MEALMESGDNGTSAGLDGDGPEKPSAAADTTGMHLLNILPSGDWIMRDMLRMDLTWNVVSFQGELGEIWAGGNFFLPCFSIQTDKGMNAPGENSLNF